MEVPRGIDEIMVENVFYAFFSPAWCQSSVEYLMQCLVSLELLRRDAHNVQFYVVHDKQCGNDIRKKNRNDT